MNHQPNHIYEFDTFRLDVAERMLLCNGEAIPLQPKAFDLLHVLVEHHGHLLEKDELLKAVWPDTIVEEVNLANNVSTLRKTLGEGGNGQRFIETVPRRGYRFVAPVREEQEGTVEPGVAEIAQSPVVAAEREEPVAAETREQSARGISRWVKRRPGLVVSLVILLLIGVVGAISSWSPKRQPTAPSVAIKSIAVLPFKPLNRSQDDEYLGIGLADAVITRLSGAGKIIVRPVSAVSKYTASTQDPLAAGREQRVDVVLDASLWRSGEKIRVTARLLNVRDGMPLWSYQCEEFCTDVFAVQTLISERMAEALMPQLTGAERARLTKRYTENREANQLYLLGRYYWNKRTEEGTRKGIACFEQAIDKDPNYALAYAGLADCYLALVFYSYEAPQGGYPKAKASAVKALELDGTLAEARSVLAGIKSVYDWDWSGAEQEFKRAIELDPNHPTVHYRYAYVLAQMGRIEESLSESRRALELDPVSLIINGNMGARLFNAHRYDEAIEQFRRLLELDPNYLYARSQLGKVYLQKGMHAEAIAEFNKASGGRTSADLGHAYAVSGQKSEALRVLAEMRELSRRHYVSPMSFAMIYTGLGEKDQAFAWLEKAYQERAVGLASLKIESVFDPLRSDARFADLLRRIGLAP